MVSPFHTTPPKSTYPIPPPLLTPYPNFLTCIPLFWSIEPLQDQWSLLALMSEIFIFCFICSGSQGSLHVYTLVGGLVPGNSGGYWWAHIIVPPAGLQTYSVPWVLFLGPLGTLCSFNWSAVSHWYFDPLLNKDQSIHTLVFLLLEIQMVFELYLGYSEILG